VRFTCRSWAIHPTTITPDQHLLLRAALDKPEVALGCFVRWWKHVDIENTGATEYRLLPLVYQNIGSLIPDRTVAARIRGVAKHVWMSNQYYAALGASALDRLKVAKVPAMILKGAAMMVAVSGENARSLHDCDILVPVEQAPEALAILNELGLDVPYMDVRQFVDYDFKKMHALSLLRTGHRVHHVDIHWCPLKIVRAKELTNEFFDQSVPCVLWGRDTRRPCFEHMLLNVIVHGTEWSVVRRYDWLADGALILRKAGSDFKWHRFADVAHRYRLDSIVRVALKELARTLDVPFPATVLLQLSRDGIIDRAEARWRNTDPLRVHAVTSSLIALQSFQRQTSRRAAWQVLPEIRRTLFGPPLRSQMRLEGAAQADDHIIYLAGWSWPEKMGRWTDGPLAAFAIQQARGQKGGFLRLGGIMLQGPDEPQIIDVYHRWRRLARLSWQGTGFGVIPLPLALSRREVFTLQLWIHRPIVPADIGLSADTRRLGLFLENIRIVSPCIRDATEVPLNLHRDSSDLDVLWSGWSSPEPQGCWTEGPNAFLRWASPRDLPTDARLVIRGLCFAPRGPLRGSISINGPHADICKLCQTSGAIDLSVPFRASPGQREVSVHIHFDNACSPHELGLSADNRTLGLFVQSIAIESDSALLGRLPSAAHVK
jgi:hypothetical protein